MRELAHRDAVKIGECGSVFVLHYDATPTMATVKVLEEVLVKRMDSEPNARWVMLINIDASAPVPDPSVQAATAKVMKGQGTRLAAMAYVVLGTGFQAGAVRFALVALTMLSGAKYPIKVFKSNDEALSWVGATVPQVASAENIAKARVEIPEFSAQVRLAG